MNQPAPLGDGMLLLAEIGAGGVAAHVVSSIPPWLGGALSALLVGFLLRLGDAPMRAVGDAVTARMRARFAFLRPPPASP